MAKQNDKNRGKGHGPKNSGGKPKGKGHTPRHVHGPGCNHDHDHGHDHGGEIEIPPGLAILPEVPVELGIDPFVLAVIDAVVFASGTDEELLHPGAGDEILEIIVGRFANLAPDKAKHLVGEIDRLRDFGKKNDWEEDSVRFLKDISDLLTGKELQ